MDVRELLKDEFNSIYFGPGLDNGSTLNEFVNEVELAINEWVDETRAELSNLEEFKGII